MPFQTKAIMLRGVCLLLCAGQIEALRRLNNYEGDKSTSWATSWTSQPKVNMRNSKGAALQDSQRRSRVQDFGGYDIGTNYTFAEKSLNLEDASAMVSYSHTPVNSMGCDVEDAHPVEGIQLESGGYFLVGKAKEGPGNKPMEAFAVMFNSTGHMKCCWQSNHSGYDVANSIVQLPTDGEEVIVAGYRQISGVSKRCLTKLNSTTCAEIWTSCDFGDTTASNGAIESVIVVTDIEIGEVCDGDYEEAGLMMAGFSGNPYSDGYNFKSYGNTEGGVATATLIPLCKLDVTTAPTISAIAATMTFTGYDSIKAVRQVGTSVALLLAKAQQSPSVVRISALLTGLPEWGPIQYSSIHEGTDMRFSSSEEWLVVVGHNNYQSGRVYKGALMTISAETGELVSNTTFSGADPARPQSIRTECWSVAAMPDDKFIACCGVGAEGDGCSKVENDAERADCFAGKADTRTTAAYTPAITISPGLWQSLILSTDDELTPEWMRVDIPKMPGDQANIGDSGWEATSAACEWIIPSIDGDGSFATVNDELNGAGLVKYAAV
eukprot:gnl/MRDRNA2_/MRDRNA2_73520_c0_seq1.p1 gnl/MRDRNA2_/MRDRNA2_73520_c0~~gnl/MRDRNA2_/MRDRNA2_73520_c0_seq1.p1  ORF type:complete len:550 (+),score=59.68 gnl/MRDRNA2_/MRDRNA2_73520_c0_seq1:133-1782(+)